MVAEAAGFDAAAREDDARATTLSLVSDVASTYLQLREADAIIAIAEQTLASRASTLQLARRRFEQGLISELDVRQFEATVADPAARVADYARPAHGRRERVVTADGICTAYNCARPTFERTS